MNKPIEPYKPLSERTVEEETDLVRSWLRENAPDAVIAQKGFAPIIMRMGIYFGRKEMDIRWEAIRAALVERFPNYVEE